MSEWLKVMLDEIARKKAEAEQIRAEAQRRGDDASGAGRGDDGRGDDGRGPGSRDDDSPVRPGPDTARPQE